jgi:hypothetical protein
MQVLRFLVALCVILAGSAVRAATPPPDFFPIAVYRQPTTSFDLWKSRGINTVIDFYAPGWGLERWNSAAVGEGLWMIRNPRKNPASDVSQPYLLAFSHADEPDVWKVPPAKLLADYRRWKAAAPSIPVIANFAGATVVGQYDSITDAKYRQYLQAVDWASNDVYPITQYNRPQWIDKLLAPASKDIQYAGVAPPTPGTAVQKLAELSGGKRQFAYIETSFQNLKGPTAAGARGATAPEVRGETWDAIIRGAKGIVYFPFTFPNKPDGTPADVAAAMTQTDATIAKYGAVLNSNGDGGSPNPMSLSGALEGTWRAYNGKTYYFVLNDSHTFQSDVAVALPGALASGSSVSVPEESRQLSLSPDGTVTDDFGPYEMHIYASGAGGFAAAAAAASAIEVAALPQGITLLPEPSGLAALLALAMASLRRPRGGRPS